MHAVENKPQASHAAAVQQTQASCNCKYCGRKHARGKEHCAAFGKKCAARSKLNHFSSQWLSQKYKTPPQQARNNKVHTVSAELHSDSEDSDYDELKSVNLIPEPEIKPVADTINPKRLYAKCVWVGRQSSFHWTVRQHAISSQHKL